MHDMSQEGLCWLGEDSEQQDGEQHNLGNHAVFDHWPVFCHLSVVGAVERPGMAEAAGGSDNDINGSCCTRQP